MFKDYCKHFTRYYWFYQRMQNTIVAKKLPHLAIELHFMRHTYHKRSYSYIHNTVQVRCEDGLENSAHTKTQTHTHSHIPGAQIKQPQQQCSTCRRHLTICKYILTLNRERRSDIGDCLAGIGRIDAAQCNQWNKFLDRVRIYLSRRCSRGGDTATALIGQEETRLILLRYHFAF